jgi:hypothetical protein
MTFDDQIHEAFETLAARLRGEIDRQVQTAVDELRAAAQADRERTTSEARASATEIETAVAAARQESRTNGHAAGREEGHATGKEQGHAAGREEGRREGIAEGRQHAEEEGRAALDAAVAAAVAGARADLPAFDAGAPADPPTFDQGSSDRLAAAVRSIDGARSLSEILDTLVICASQQSARAGVWLVRGGRFASWRVIGFGPELDNDLSNRSLDIWSDDAGMIAEAARTNMAVLGDAGEVAPPPFATQPPVRASVAVPVAMSGQVVAVLYADDGPSDPPARLLNRAAVEVLTRYAARCLEALTAFKAARALTERPDRPDATLTPAADVAVGEDEASARRYARLLVSEIKLYHESAVLDGRRDRDLATRLGGEITRARVLYEQRVPPDVRQRADFFHDELVRTLADGDASLLEVKT